MTLPKTKVALDARTDQALAIFRDGRAEDDSYTENAAGVAGHLAAAVAEQFPRDRETAGRVLVTASLFVIAALRMAPDLPAIAFGSILGFAGEQVTREAAEAGGVP
jgi:hypothetical protein